MACAATADTAARLRREQMYWVQLKSLAMHKSLTIRTASYVPTAQLQNLPIRVSYSYSVVQQSLRSTAFAIMARSAQGSSRPTTRSMTTTRTRRSTRLSRPHGKSRSSPSSPSSANVRTRSKRRSKPSPSTNDHASRRDQKCAQPDTEEHPDAEKATGDCDTSVRTRSFRSSRNTTTCNQVSLSRVKELEKDLEKALQAKKDLTLIVKQYKINEAMSALKHLEEYFACPLCFEVMAYPYSLNPRHCGHSFCATCILKWFFSRMHLGCGGWHEAVDCPMCRSPLVHTPDQTPRSDVSFPFTPNRTADIAICGLINTISTDVENSSQTASNSLSDWYADGHARQEWSKRERAGRTEMTSLAVQWNNLTPNDFVNIKARLEV
ncbi:hypothetical protein F5I97DRAFT_81655 [Phlebopus sp. FC_14]|nr:hypothetical protein F5I97DRAFT_81655 [Phlebopus sp. FC_14]